MFRPGFYFRGADSHRSRRPDNALHEIHRCAKTWIWGFEYYAPKSTEIVYRGHRSLLWKTDFARTYLQQFPDLELVREERFPYLQDANIDTAFLLRRKS